ncbi:cobalamin-dependent protein [Streptomyces sp. TRM 70351]|uniref:cobalamin B12-binding domain-containing protein n=1 Tax=Streptomyces sp. TRM 70351 TaxID=3116552 RepID=UPI002E7B34E4|nr:cobalamin-dependent protein [Streptomyces sp. TRM 70351]MEE1929021.1 cobalamin-dependent protein [Streptomyces sp. TRM 70351]
MDGRNTERSGGLDITVTTVASDSHTWNLVYLQLLLEELGHRVSNLGPCVPGNLLVDECRTRRPDLIVISSVNGHGHQDGARVIAALRACPALAGTPVVIGGKLGITGQRDAAGRARDLLARGFDAVFEGPGAEDAFRAHLAALAPLAGCGLPGAPR